METYIGKIASVEEVGFFLKTHQACQENPLFEELGIEEILGYAQFYGFPHDKKYSFIYKNTAVSVFRNRLCIGYLDLYGNGIDIASSDFYCKAASVLKLAKTLTTELESHRLIDTFTKYLKLVGQCK